MYTTAMIHWNTDEKQNAVCDWKRAAEVGTERDYVHIRIGFALDLFCTPAQALALRAAIGDCPELREWEAAQQDPPCTCAYIDADQVDARQCEAHAKREPAVQLVGGGNEAPGF